MANKPLDTELLDRAITFAVKAHSGTERRGKGFPYIVHPMEAMSIVSTMASDQELLAAAALHDTVEDTDVTVEQLRGEFGDRVADLVAAETDTLFEGVSEEDSWKERKRLAIDQLRKAPREVKIVAMGDKLSNLRAIARDYAQKGDDLWNIFHVKDMEAHAWRYRELADALKELDGTAAYSEFVELTEKIFGNTNSAIKISLDDYVLSGGGANGESYNHRTDPAVMLKLYFPGKITQPLDELTLARKVYALGIPTPEPGDYVVTEDGRYGIRFRRITDKVSFSRATADNPEEVQRYAEEFAQMCLELHSIHVGTTEFESVKDRYLHLLETNPFFTADEKAKIAKFIFDAPDSDTAAHGDLQYSNAIISGDKKYFIDLGDFGYGYYMFDVAMVYLCCCLSSEEFILETFHMSKQLSRRFWECFARAYFGGDRPLADIEEELMPYAGLKTLIIERDTQCPMPEFRKALKPILL